MQGNDPEFIEAERLALKFFPECKPWLVAEGLTLGALVSAMAMGNYQCDYSGDPYGIPEGPNLGFAKAGGTDGSPSEVYARILNHTSINPEGRAIVVLDLLGRSGSSTDERRPFLCDARRVAERLDEIEFVFNHNDDMAFIFESGEAIAIDHDDRLYWARSQILKKSGEKRIDT